MAKREVARQLIVRLYSQGSPSEQAILAGLEPLERGMLRLVLIEALARGLRSLRKDGWPVGEAPGEFAPQSGKKPEKQDYQQQAAADYQPKTIPPTFKQV